MLNLTREQINSLYPVIGATLYNGVVVIERLNLSPYDGLRIKGERGKIGELSKRSLSNLTSLAIVNALRFNTLVTLTYGANFPTNGRTVKVHLNRVLTRLRQVYGGVDYLWFLEFQRRNAPHIHILTSLSAPSDGERAWLAEFWSRVSNDGNDWLYSSIRLYRGRLRRHSSLSTMGAVRYSHLDHNVWSEIKTRKGAGRYVIKYSTKLYQKRIPEWYRDVGRWWGASRNVTMGNGEMVTGSEAQIREYLRFRGRDVSKWDLLPRVVYCNS